MLNRMMRLVYVFIYDSIGYFTLYRTPDDSLTFENIQGAGTIESITQVEEVTAVLALIAFLALSYWTVMLILYLSRRKFIQHLPFQERNDCPAQPLPLVSVIVAAKEEEHSITETIQHLLSQTYSHLEIIAINDRSADTTGTKLDELKRWSERKKDAPVKLTVIHIRNLPKGWLGKNHALYQGYLQAKGQMLLFTDADVTFAPNAISDAVAFMLQARLDHLTASPFMIARRFWLQAFVHYFLFSLGLFKQLWLANDDSRRTHGMGIGAFNMMTRGAYESIGTHQAFALRPDDDLQLGARVKLAGLKQRLVAGKDHLEVEWYPDLPSAVKGLEKNIFSGFDYHYLWAGAGIMGQALLYFFPFIGVWFASSWSMAAYLLSIVFMVFLYLSMIRPLSRKPGWEVLVLPVSVLLLIYVFSRSVLLTWLQKGVYWRGTFYSLDELKKMK